MDEEHEEAGTAGTARRSAPRRRRGISFAAPEEAADGIEEDGEAAAEPEREAIEEVGCVGEIVSWSGWGTRRCGIASNAGCACLLLGGRMRHVA